jgi:predicted transcriptional regulator
MIANRNASGYGAGMTTTLSLKLPKALAARLEVAARARKTTPAKVARECLERELPASEEQEPWIIHWQTFQRDGEVSR